MIAARFSPSPADRVGTMELARSERSRGGLAPMQTERQSYFFFCR
jgi:hypothetical protein